MDSPSPGRPEVPPAETLAYRLRRAVSLASRTPEAPRAVVESRPRADPSRLAQLAQPRRITAAGGSPPTVDRPSCVRPPQTDLLRAQVETGPQYHPVAGSVARVRVTLKASRDDLLPRSRRRLFLRHQGGSGGTRPVVHLTRPRFDERRNSLLRFQERTGVGLLLLALDLRMQLLGTPSLAYGALSLPKPLL